MPAQDLPQIGFPPPLLDARPLRLPILRQGEGYLVMAKPAGIATAPHPWYEVPDLTTAINSQVEAGKPELTRLGVGKVAPAFALDPEIAGAALLTTTPEALETHRNAFGSSLVRLRFHFLARGHRRGETAPEGSLPEPFSCDLPIATHVEKPRVLVSHRTGKKSLTHFRPLCLLRGGILWEAETGYCRFHQVRLHLYESGLRVPGEMHYGREAPLFLSTLRGRRQPRPDEYPAWEFPAIVLRSLQMPGEEEPIELPYPQKFALVLKTLGWEDAA